MPTAPEHPYDATGANPAARLTIDVGAGDRWLIALNRYATANWLHPDHPVLDYANAMVSGTASGTPTNWQEHVDGKPQYAPPVPPLAPAKFTGGLYLKGNLANCTELRVLGAEKACHVPTVGDSQDFSRRPGEAGNSRHAGLHVLGGRIPVSAQGLYGHRASQLLRRRHGRRRHDVQNSHSDARVASALKQASDLGARVTRPGLHLGSCRWRNRSQAAMGSSNRPRQCCCQP